jgi:hypothetical protein
MNYYNQKKSEAVIGDKIIPVGRAFKKDICRAYQEFLRREAE